MGTATGAEVKVFCDEQLQAITPSGGSGVTKGEYLMHQRQPNKRRLIVIGRRLDDGEIGHQRLRVRHRHAAAETEL